MTGVEKKGSGERRAGKRLYIVVTTGQPKQRIIEVLYGRDSHPSSSSEA